MTAYEQGYVAYGKGADVQDNPFHMYDVGHDAWVDGWLASQEYHFNEGA